MTYTKCISKTNISSRGGEDSWKYYNHALIPMCSPNETPNLEQLNEAFKKNKRALFARWTTDWDTEEETEWWYIIKDSPFDIYNLNSNRRHKINKGMKYFFIEKIDYAKYANEICQIAFSVWKNYPTKYRPKITKDEFNNEIKLKWKDKIVYGAFDIVTKKLCGYALLKEYENYVDFIQLKVMIEFEKKCINFAIINQILNDYNSRLSKNFYISDGTRNIIHETNFQDFLEKYFGFRKSYCRLVIKYRFPINFVVKILKIFKKFINSSSGLGCKIQGLLFMDDISCKCRK